MRKCINGGAARVPHHAIIALGLALGLIAATAEAAEVPAAHLEVGAAKTTGCHHATLCSESAFIVSVPHFASFGTRIVETLYARKSWAT